MIRVPQTSTYSIPLSLRLSSCALKIIAIISMVADHYAYFLVEHDTTMYDLLRTFGRIAFPVFAFLIAEGFANTRNRMRYFLTILGFAVVSEVPWYLLNGTDGTHNVMFALALGVVALALFDRLCKHGFLCCFSISFVGAFAWRLGVDYDWRGIMMITLFYMLRRQTIDPWISRNEICFPKQALRQLLFTFPLMIHYGFTGAILASIVIFFYDGTRGNIKGAVAQYGFYAFYPLHFLYVYYLSVL